MSTFRMQDNARSVRLGILQTTVDFATQTPLLRFYKGTQPSSYSSTHSQTIMAIISFAASATTSGFTLKWSYANPTFTVDVGGTPTWGAWYDGQSVEYFQFDVGVTGAGAYMEFPSTDWSAGAVFDVPSGTWNVIEGDA